MVGDSRVVDEPVISTVLLRSTEGWQMHTLVMFKTLLLREEGGWFNKAPPGLLLCSVVDPRPMTFLTEASWKETNHAKISRVLALFI